jgi:hypothetical protein
MIRLRSAWRSRSGQDDDLPDIAYGDEKNRRPAVVSLMSWIEGRSRNLKRPVRRAADVLMVLLFTKSTRRKAGLRGFHEGSASTLSKTQDDQRFSLPFFPNVCHRGSNSRSK